ncbi:hypothetical protein OAL55_01315 [Verrucomicrobiales bacterium]|jgi:hypothetical protein|nr:hypothetical protein [Verrucomicrobiales bacterium]
MKGLLIFLGVSFVSALISCSKVDSDDEQIIDEGLVTIENAKLENCGEVLRVLEPLLENGNRLVRINGHLYDGINLEFNPGLNFQVEPSFVPAAFFDYISEAGNTAWEKESSIVLRMRLSPDEPTATLFQLLDICEVREWNYQFGKSEGESSVEVWAWTQ